MRRVLLAPDKFKGTLTAAEVAAHLATGLRAGAPEVEVRALPVADGGDGTVAAALAAGFERVAVTVTGPTGGPRATAWARRGEHAVVELADACGLAALPGARLAPMTASTRGLGDAIGAALGAGCTHVLVGLGGSASTDGGAGLLRALGAEVLDASGAPVGEGGGALADAAALDVSGLARTPGLAGATIEVASDVDNPLTGPRGAAATYGPQKGATPDQVGALDAALAHWAGLVTTATGGKDRRGEPGAGAAGGSGFALVAVLGATLRPGADAVLDLIGFDAALDGVDLVVVGEGALDAQTLHGKAPLVVARRAAVRGIPVVAVAGSFHLDPATLSRNGIHTAYSLVDEAGSLREALTAPGPLLERVGARIAAAHLSE